MTKVGSTLWTPPRLTWWNKRPMFPQSKGWTTRNHLRGNWSLIHTRKGGFRLDIDLVMAYAGKAVYWAAILCGLLALIRVFISDKHRTILSLSFFIPSILYFVSVFGLLGTNVLELKGDFLSNRDVWRPASLFFVMALANILQFVVLVLGAVLILQKRVNRVNIVLFSVTTVLVLFLSILRSDPAALSS